MITLYDLEYLRSLDNFLICLLSFNKGIILLYNLCYKIVYKCLNCFLHLKGYILALQCFDESSQICSMKRKICVDSKPTTFEFHLLYKAFCSGHNAEYLIKFAQNSGLPVWLCWGQTRVPCPGGFWSLPRSMAVVQPAGTPGGSTPARCPGHRDWTLEHGPGSSGSGSRSHWRARVEVAANSGHR